MVSKHKTIFFNIRLGFVFVSFLFFWLDLGLLSEKLIRHSVIFIFRILVKGIQG